jgi:hypothetical protein
MAQTAVKTARTLQGSVSNAAGGVTAGGTIDLGTALGMLVTGRVTNGSTGPTAACEFVLEVSHDGAGWFEFCRLVSDDGADAVSEFAVELPGPVMRVRSVFEGNTGQPVTVEAYGHELTSVG